MQTAEVPRLPLPRPGKVICCGLNYGDHIAETGREQPEYPTLFAKYADTLLPDGADIVLPAGLQVDWEAELAVVVGAELRHATRAEAERAIGGYTVANDISVRDWQRRTLQWFQGKAWDATTPIGPVVVSPDQLDPVAGVEVICRVNGVERQRGNTKTLVFDCPTLLAYISTFTVLRPGDVVLTGTPGGVGMGMTPPTYLADGDVVETEIPGIGVLTNTVRLTARHPTDRTPMDPHTNHPLEGDNTMYANESGLVVPVVTRAGFEPDLTGQSEGATRISGVSIQHTPATKLWFGKVQNLAGYRSVPHHHGEAETGGYVLSGRARIYFGEKFEDYIDMSEGDWVFVPPFMPHVECNLDRNNPLTWMTTRTPENIVVNLAQVDDADLRDWADRP